MLVKVKWFMTGSITEINEPDDLLNARTTILELKGLLQVRFGFSPKELVLIHHHLLDNYQTLGEIGIVSSDSDIVLTAHVIRKEAKLEKKNPIDGSAANDDDDDAAGDDDLQEFSHEDYILAMRMLGRDVPVHGDRLQQVREQAPRSRPQFLNTSSSGGAGSAAAASVSQHTARQTAASSSHTEGYNPRNTEVHRIFRDYRYGLRKEGVEKTFRIDYPGEEPYEYWDMRLPEDDRHQSLCSLNEVCFEMFFFGEYKRIHDHAKFLTLVRRVLEVHAGVQARTPLPIREAGCMYPLVAVPVIVTEMEGMNLGALLFEEFGTATGTTHHTDKSAEGAAVAGKASACGQQ